MARKKKKKTRSRAKKKKSGNKSISRKQGRKKGVKKEPLINLHPETKTSLIALAFLCVAVLLVLSRFDKAGPAGRLIFRVADILLGVGYFALPALLLLTGTVFFFSIRIKPRGTTLGGLVIFLSGLGIIDIIESGKGGLLGAMGGALEKPFGPTAGIIVSTFVLLAGILITFNVPLRMPQLRGTGFGDDEDEDDVSEMAQVVPAVAAPIDTHKEEAPSAPVDTEREPTVIDSNASEGKKESKRSNTDDSSSSLHLSSSGQQYTPPPLSLLEDASGNPTSGDIKANANTIRRTFSSFNIPVEMAEVHVGPKVTRFSLKPAEGIKLSRIVGLQNDLALALAAHPIRIEAPIPGKSLVGIEVPNKASALVRLKHLMTLEHFRASGPLNVPLGKDVSGEVVFADITKAPHMLIAGSSGAGKSVTIHTLLVSLLYKNSPETLRLILVDPKRVELTPYNDIPHMATPVITEPKKAILALKFAIKEMDERYNMLMEARSRDIVSYNKKQAKKGEPLLPYIVIVIDELADLMATYPREIEGSIVRLAQMARATGIHLVVSTQRPSVEVVTGLIKANITSRIALQVASQVDSRTILDMAGAEKLLGGGDMLFVSGELSKPKRIQGAFLSEKEVKRVVDNIRANNGVSYDEVKLESGEGSGTEQMVDLDDFDASDVEDDKYDEAVELVKKAGKASASMLQRRLRVGYARAARLLDIMEEHGLIGPVDGAKPREVFIVDDDGEISEDASDDGNDYMSA